MALVVFGLGITYSIFNSNTLAAGNQKIAKFIFNAEEVDKLSLPITDLKPGYTNDFDLSIFNETTIPKGKYLVLGDNRPISKDSRMIGLIDKKNITGYTSLEVYPSIKRVK